MIIMAASIIPVKLTYIRLKANSWKEISDPGVNVQPSAEFDVYVDRFCYWLSFDMDNERFSTLPLSEFDVGLEQHNLLPLNYNGLLGGIYYPREGTLKSFDLWIMSRSWTKQFNIESVSGVERLLGFWKNGELFLESSDDELVLFDPSTRELKNLDKLSFSVSCSIASLVAFEFWFFLNSILFFKLKLMSVASTVCKSCWCFEFCFRFHVPTGNIIEFETAYPAPRSLLSS
ncbi:hypothetical protein V6N13_052982 [Hibiscus sabdariffa]